MGNGALDGRVIVVTGASRGIGRAIARACASAGARVSVASRTASAVDAVVEEITAAGGDALGLTVDVGERDAVEAMIADTVEHFGALDVLFNNAQGFGSKEEPAGSPGFIALEEFPDDVWEHTFRTGAQATLWGMQAAFPHLRERGGKIVNFGSGNGIANMRGTAAYNATKEAIRALTRTAAVEWGPLGITVNVIIPNITTDAARDFLDSRPGVAEKLIRQMPLRRFGNDDDIGGVAVFLSSSHSDYITGQTIHVDGGQIMNP